MIVGIDARELGGKPTGVGTYLREILKRITLPPGVRRILFFRNTLPGGLENLEGDRIVVPARGGNLLWQQWSLRQEAARLGVQLLFSPANSLPWKFRAFQALTVHDISFFREPQWFSFRERLSRRVNTGFSLQRADRIYTVSEYVRQELISRFGLAEGKILVTPNGVTANPCSAMERERLRQSRGLSGTKLILFVGSIFNRRHVPVLIEAVKHLDASHRLVIIGENRTHPHQDLAAESKRHGVESRVELLEYAPVEVVQDYYNMADVFVYLSDYEGFGIPPLEAMGMGVPAVISDTPAMNTIFQSAARLAADMRPETLAAAIRDVTTDARQRENLVRAGLELAARYNWDNTARIISRDWEQILGAIR